MLGSSNLTLVDLAKLGKNNFVVLEVIGRVKSVPKRKDKGRAKMNKRGIKSGRNLTP